MTRYICTVTRMYTKKSNNVKVMVLYYAKILYLLVQTQMGACVPVAQVWQVWQVYPGVLYCHVVDFCSQAKQTGTNTQILCLILTMWGPRPACFIHGGSRVSSGHYRFKPRAGVNRLRVEMLTPTIAVLLMLYFIVLNKKYWSCYLQHNLTLTLTIVIIQKV